MPTHHVPGRSSLNPSPVLASVQKWSGSLTDTWAPTLKKSNQLPSVRSSKVLNLPSRGKVTPEAVLGWQWQLLDGAEALLGWSSVDLIHPQDCPNRTGRGWDFPAILLHPAEHSQPRVRLCHQSLWEHLGAHIHPTPPVLPSRNTQPWWLMDNSSAAFHF